jgi:hypothetical protein
MFKPELRQLKFDFRDAPSLVERHFPEEEYEGSVKMIRQVNGVTTYLSQMATGEHRMHEGYHFAAGAAGMDVVTDFHHEDLSGGVVEDALEGDPPFDCLHPLVNASKIARGPEFDRSIKQLALWQDRSRRQFKNPSIEEVREITHMKGGCSAMAHLHAVKEEPTDEEESLMFEFGHLMQCLDDYLDQPKDEKEGISTLFTTGEMNVSDLCRLWEDVMRQCKQVFGDSTAYRRFRKVTRAHILMGDVENTTPLSASTLCPWYF